MRTTWLITAALALALGPTALADTIQQSVSSSVSTSVSSPNDNFYGTYANVAGIPFFVGHPSISGFVSVPFSNFSVLLPAGSTFVNALVNITVPEPLSPAIGTGHMFALTPFPGEINPSLPSVPPTFSNTGTSDVYVALINGSLGTALNGNQVSTNIQSLGFLLSGVIESALVDPGSNWAGFLGGNGEVVIPYTVELDVTYTPAVPEPSSLALLGTGALGLLATISRRNSQKI